MRSRAVSFAVAILALLHPIVSSDLPAAEEPESPEEQIEEIDQRLKIPERKAENDEAKLRHGLDLPAACTAGVRVAAQEHFPCSAVGLGGAVELVARASTLDVDDAFPVFADPARSASRSGEWAFGVNWYLSRNVRIALNYNETRFEGGAAGGADRPTEKVVFSRFQLSF